MAKYEVDGTSAKAPEDNAPFLHMVKNEITPDTSGISSIKPDDSKKQNQKVVNFNDAKERLRGEESSASGDIGQSAKNLSDVRSKENRADGLYSGSGKSASDAKSKGGRGKGRGKGFLKKGGPIGAILGIFLAVGGFMGVGQTLMPFSLVSQFRETFNSMHTSTSRRANSFLRYQMDNGLVKDPIKSRIFRADTFKITDKQASELAMRGIEYDEDFKGEGIRVLKYDDGSGEIRIVAADERSAKSLGNLSRFNTDDVKYKSEAVTFRNIYESDVNFFKSYNSGSLTWRGAIANWFGDVTKKFFGDNKLTRNLFKNFDQDVKDAGGDARVAATELIAKGADEVEEGGHKIKTLEDDEDGSKKFGDDVVTETTKTKRSDLMSVEATKQKLTDISEKLNGKVSGVAQAAVNYTCLAVNFLGSVSLLVAATEALQIIHLTTAYFEAIDKVKAGDGDASPLNTLMDALTDKKTSINSELVSSGETDISNLTGSEIPTLSVREVTSEDKSAMDSNGIASLYSGNNADPNDPSVKSFNFSSSIKTILGSIGLSMTAFSTCTLAKLGANLVDMAGDLAEIGACLFPELVSSAIGCGALVLKALLSIGTSMIASYAISSFIASITPYVAKIFTRDLITNLGGEDLGNALTSGGNMYLGGTHRYNGGSLATTAKYEEYAIAQQQVIAEDAKQERLTKSPFDMTSQNTFMGTLLNQMIGFIYSNSLTSVITSASSAVSSSIVAMSPVASAYDISKHLPNEEEYADTCPYLASIGAIGDSFCNPYMITDVTTIDSDPSEITNELNENFMDELSSDGNVRIKGNSDLAKYIVFCDKRNSAFGVADQDIVNQVSDFASVNTESSSFNSLANGAFGGVPVIGDGIDVIANIQAFQNRGYVSGESCVAGNSVSGQSAPGWDKAKKYQRFIEDQSLMESMGLVEKSAVAVYLEEYYKENPLDNSYEGVLARYSGLDKETVVDMLDIIDYYNYIANYNPSERYAFGEPAVKVEKELRFDNENQVAESPLIILINQTVYADVRNRSFAV